MGERVVLHIGTMKSGTSFVQSVLMQSQEALASEGVEFLGGTFAKQARAVREVLQKPGKPKRNQPSWAQLAEAAKAHDGHTSMVSMEFLSFARPGHLDQLLKPLSGLQVDVVVTVRDQFRAIPAQWQTFTRNMGLDDWETYLRSIEGSRLGRLRKTDAHRTYHRAQGVPAMLERWGARPEVHEVTVATVPPAGAPRDELWQRFCEAARIASVTPALDEVRENPSLGYASCEYLRLLNHHLADVPPRTYRGGVRPLAREVLVHLRHQEGRPELDRAAASFARTMNERLRTAVRDRGHRLVGSLDDLPLPDDLAEYPRAVPPVPASDLRLAAERAWAHLAAQIDDPGPPPTDVEQLVAGAATLLRELNGWAR